MTTTSTARLVGSAMLMMSLVWLLAVPLTAHAGEAFSVSDTLSFPMADNLVASPVGDRVAWVFYERGVRNVWVAEAPAWTPRVLTKFTHDEGKPIDELAFSADGSTLVFVRNAGEGNRPPPGGVRANAASLPTAPHVEVWAAPFGVHLILVQ